MNSIQEKIKAICFMKTHALSVCGKYTIDNPKFALKNPLFYAQNLYRLDHALSLTQPMLWDNGDYPGILGTCSPIWYKQRMYLLTAKHSIQNSDVSNLSYLVDFERKECLLLDSFNSINLNKISKSRTDDFVMILVKDENSLGIRRDWAFDIENDKISYKSDIIDAFIRGAPSVINGVDYDNEKIQERCFITEGFESIDSDEGYPGCFWLKMKTPLPEEFNDDANGMSGSIVYGMNEKCEAGILGIVIGYNIYTKNYLVLSIESILASLKGIMDYKDIFQNLKEHLTSLSSSIGTRGFTKEIVNFFKSKFPSHHVLSHVGSREYLYDICVLDFDPLDIHKNEKESYKIHLVVESELGGKSASSAKLVEKNVIEDFFKILQANAENKIFIGIYSSNRNETDALENRITKMFDIAKKTDNQSTILVVLIEGDHLGRSRQVKIKRPLNINGYIMTTQNFTAINELN